VSTRLLAFGTMLAGALAATGIASAADLGGSAPVYKAAPVQTFSWTGCYVGGNAGGIFNNSNITSGPTISGAPFTDNVSSFNLSGTDFTAGLQYGCNKQVTPNFVFGIDSSFNWSGLSESVAFSHPAGGGRPFAYTGTVTQDLNWLSTTRARVGWAQDRWMVFAAGGLATGKIKSSYSDFEAGNDRAFFGSDSTTRYGWTIGGGVEYALSENWFVRGEYLYVDLGKTRYESFSNTPGSGTWLTEVDTRAHIVRAALTYRITTAESWFEWAKGGFK
jgi:outer membrane immunogenic protein